MVADSSPLHTTLPYSSTHTRAGLVYWLVTEESLLNLRRSPTSNCSAIVCKQTAPQSVSCLFERDGCNSQARMVMAVDNSRVIDHNYKCNSDRKTCTMCIMWAWH